MQKILGVLSIIASLFFIIFYLSLLITCGFLTTDILIRSIQNSCTSDEELTNMTLMGIWLLLTFIAKKYADEN